MNPPGGEKLHPGEWGEKVLGDKPKQKSGWA